MGDNVNAVVGTLDLVGWSWLLVAVCRARSTQTGARRTVPTQTEHLYSVFFRNLVMQPQRSQVSRTEERISSAREANVSNPWLISDVSNRGIASRSQPGGAAS